MKPKEQRAWEKPPWSALLLFTLGTGIQGPPFCFSGGN